MRRRSFIASMIAGASLPRLGWADAGSPAFLAAAMNRAGQYQLHGLGPDGQSLFALPLPARGHAATAHPQRPEAVAFARRPGTFALVIDCARGREIAHLSPPEGRQFNGHGTFSADGQILYTSEVVAEGSAGRIGLWDAAAGYARIGEWSSGGIGPHDIKRLPLSDDLVIANGGIQTDPSDRSKLNLDQMRPNLARITPAGEIAALAELPADLHQNSLRHLAVLPDGRLACAAQWEGDPAETVPLLVIWQQDRLMACPAPETEGFLMQGYAGSIAWSARDGTIALTSPRGGAVQVFASDGRYCATFRRADACGVAAGPDGLIVTDGNGAISQLDGTGLHPRHSLPVAWDNHLVALG